MTLDLDLFKATPLQTDPFDFLVIPGFVKEEARERINADYPEVSKSGSFPLDEVTFGPGFQSLIDDLNGDEMRVAFEEKFHIDLSGKPTMTTVRGRCSEKDGKIHTDSDTKIITVLIYLNSRWEQPGGQLRLLRSATDLDDVIMEVPPTEGTLLAFRRCANSYHGHKKFSGPRRVVQFNWVTSQAVVDRAMTRHRFSSWTKKLQTVFAGGAKA